MDAAVGPSIVRSVMFVRERARERERKRKRSEEREGESTLCWPIDFESSGAVIFSCPANYSRL